MKIAVTGATGYIGSALLIAIAKRGYKSLAMSRRSPVGSYESIEYNLSDTNISLPNDVDCVVHLAMNFELSSVVQQQNEIQAALLLAKACEEIGARFIYISSQTADEQASTSYGLTKWKIEKITASYNGIIIRPGLVYGGKASGLFRQLMTLMHKSPVIPCFIPAPKVQPIHVDDLCEAILRALEKVSPTETRTLCIAEHQCMGFHRFLKLLSIYRLRKPRLYLPIPRLLIDLAYKIKPTNPSLIRLHSLFNLPVMKTDFDLAFLGLSLRNSISGFHPAGNGYRRELLSEAFVLYSYILRHPPALFSLRRYAKYMEASRENAIGLKPVLKFFPSLVGVIDNNHSLKNEDWYLDLMRRLDTATVIAEASVQGAKRFLRLDKHNSFIFSVFILTTSVFCELIMRVSSWLLLPISKKIFLDIQR